MHILRTLLVISMLSVLMACSEERAPLEEEIQQFITQGKQATETRRSGDLADLVHDQYSDHKNMNKPQVIQLARAYFFRHKNIHLFTQLDSYHQQDEKHVFAVVYVAMTGSVVHDVNTLSKLRARVYRFDLQLVRDDDLWQVQQAKWQPAALKDLL